MKSEFPPEEGLQEEPEFQEHFYPGEDFNADGLAPDHFQEDVPEEGEESKEHFEDQEPFEAREHHERLEQLENQEYFDNQENFEGEVLHEVPEQQEEHFGDQEQSENEEHIESMELHESQEKFQNPSYFENQEHYKDQEYCEEEKEPEVESELPIEHPSPPELLHASEQVEHTDHLLENPEGHIETPQDTDILDKAHMNLVGETDQFTVEKQESTPFHSIARIGAGEAEIDDFQPEASLASSEHPAEWNRHTADALDIAVSEQPIVPQPPVMHIKDAVQQEAKPSFHDIKKNLERRNIVGSLQSQPPQTHQRAGLSDMELPRSGGYSGSHMNGSETPSYSQHRTPGGPLSPSEDASAHQTMNRGGNREGRGNTPAGLAQVRQTLALPDLQLSHVTVFTDRAELVRTITPVFKAGEIVEMLFENVSTAIDKDSIRVELRGAATILDVTYTARTVPHLEETWAQSIADLQTELRQCHRQIEAVTGRLARLEKQRTVLDTFADGMTKKTEEEVFAAALPQPPPMPLPQYDKKHDKHSKKAPPVYEDSLATGLAKRSVSELNNQANPYDPSHMDTLQRFLTMYEDQAERLDSSLLSSKEELDRTRDRAEQIEKELDMLEKRQDENLVREISVLIEPREDGPVDMLITYVVSRCLWKPAYDIRLFNSDGSMKIIYYGLVQQSTGEDWEPRRMTLSTAQPSSEGLCPSLGLQRLHYKQTTPQPTSLPSVSSASSSRPPRPVSSASRNKTPRALAQAQHQHSLLNENGSHAPESPRIASTPHGTLQRAPSNAEPGTSTLRGSSISRAASRQALGTSLLVNAAPPNELQITSTAKLTTTPTSAVATVIFEVPRPPAIVACNNEEVRVTVGLIDLQPSYDYVTVPKRSLSAFLKARVKNSSNFYILPGQTNIYSDNTFIGKSELGAVAPGEELSCELGAESGIEVIYRPMFKSKENASGQKATVSFKQVIDVRNTFQRPVRVMVVDQLPSSGEDKIKVNLIEPNIKNPEKYDKKKPIRMNKHHNIEWDLDLHAGETKEVVLRYTVEYPAVEELEVSVAED
uniref:DUF4201 domain-containing protein n=1 Tax=Echinococcus granulosus TaxID=6210 RepID=A0A068WFB0_ECHGR|nr:hypothetical protein EgrG_000658900 [Echinococcus granulosus]